jgi:predicted SAM-dependent methyltransferase
MIRLNLGCGSLRPLGWINTDSSINANVQKIPLIGKQIAKMFNPVEYESDNFVYMNLNKSWNYANDSVDVVYASHLFEHLTLNSTDVFLKEAYRTLKPGGVIRIVVPDLYKICKKYISEFENNNFEGTSTDFIMWAINMHLEGQYGNPSFIKKLFLEWQGYPHQHKFMYDDKSLTNKLTQYGFKNLKSLSYGISDLIPEIKDVEGTKESYLSVYIEGIK